MDISINTPALFFPAISLVMLAYTNRFLAVASVVRNLHIQYNQGDKKKQLHGQIRNLKYRLRLIKNMQAFGVVSFLSCIFSMYFIYLEHMTFAHIMFGLTMLAFIVSLIMSLIEIQLSTKALELELSDMEDLEDPSIVEYLKKKFERE
ncbi:MAG: family cellulose-binding protein [Segetibacter sp.]|nr:family cellulose-binding protein [Segetibacter sp.]